MTIFSKNVNVFFFLMGLRVLNQNSTIKLHFYLLKKWRKTCQEKVVRQWEENKFTNFEIRGQMSKEGSEAVRRK